MAFLWEGVALSSANSLFRLVRNRLALGVNLIFGVVGLNLDELALNRRHTI